MSFYLSISKKSSIFAPQMRLLRKIFVCLMVFGGLLSTNSAYAQKKKVKADFKSWQMRNEYGIADSVSIDTMPVNLAMRDMLNDHSISWAYNGNLVSPAQSKIYFDRSGNGMLSSTGTGGYIWTNGGLGLAGGARKKTEFLFSSAYEPYLLTAQDVRFHRTHIAYSDIAYKKSFTKYHGENDLSFSFTGNINPKTNFGVRINYLNAAGRYTDQEGKIANGYVYASYDGNHYGFHTAFCFNKLSNFENGGLQDVSKLGGALNAEDMPTNMHGMSGLSNLSALFDHHYSLTVEKERKMVIKGRNGEPDRDSIYTEYIPVTTFNHTFELNNSTKRYIEHSARQGFYSDNYLNNQSTHDTTCLLNIRNTLAVTFNEEFNKVLRFGATVYATNECQRYGYLGIPYNKNLPTEMFEANMSMTPHISVMGDTTYTRHWTNNTWVGGSIYKRSGKWIKYDVNGDVCLVGYKIGEFQVNGHVDLEFPVGKDSMFVRVSGYVKNETPDWFLQHYTSNHYRWDNDFHKTYRFYVGGEWSYPTKWFKTRARFGFENVTDYIGFGATGGPQQMDGNIQIFSGDVRGDLTTPWVNLENSIVYQHSSSDAIPLPMLTLYHNLYYHGWWFKALYTQMGVDMRYHTAYYAPVLDPAIGQFRTQSDVLIGNYPVMNLYANFYVKYLKLKFFVQWQHFNYYFMKNKTYLSMPDYAMNPSGFRAGLAWHFWK